MHLRASYGRSRTRTQEFTLVTVTVLLRMHHGQLVASRMHGSIGEKL